ncbi:MAG: hypothetical protein ACE5IZ_02760 [Dehalococcoidia bacterium]
MMTITKTTDDTLEQRLEELLSRFLCQRFGIRGNPRAIIPYLHRHGLAEATALWGEFTGYATEALAPQYAAAGSEAMPVGAAAC